MTVRRSVVAAVLVVSCLLAAAGCGGGGEPPRGLKIGLASDDLGGPGDATFIKSVKAGVHQVQKESPGSVAELRELPSRNAETADDKYDRLIILCESGYDPVIAVGWRYAGADPATGPLARAAQTCPKTHFAIVDDATVSAPNVADLAFADQQGAFLAGIVAAARSRTGKVAFLGGCKIPLITTYEAGYRAGVEAGNGDDSVRTAYLSDSGRQQCSGFYDEYDGRLTADKFYGAGVDTVFTVSGGGDLGVFESATAHNTMAIGSYDDADQDLDPTLRGAVVTSIVKHADIVVADFLRKLIRGSFAPGVASYGLDSNAITYATSGGRIKDLTAELDGYRQKIINGSIVVPDSV